MQRQLSCKLKHFQFISSLIDSLGISYSNLQSRQQYQQQRLHQSEVIPTPVSQTQQGEVKDRRHLLKGEIYGKWLTGRISRCESLSELQVMVLEDGWQFSPINLSAAFVRVTKLKESSPGQVTSIMAKLVGYLTSEIIEKMNPQSLANTFWALGKTKYGSTPEGQSIMKALLLQCEGLADIFLPQNISNVLWSMATCGLKDEIAFRSLALATLDKREIMKVQEVSNILWAMGTLRIVDEQLLRRFIAVAHDNIHLLTSQNMANILMAKGTLRYYDEEFMDSVADLILNDDPTVLVKQKFSTIAALQVLGACANLNYKRAPFLRWILQKTGPAHEMSLQGLVNTMYFWALLDQPLIAIQKVTQEIVQRYKKNRAEFQDVHYRQFWFAAILFNTKLEVVNMQDQLRSTAQARWNDTLENPLASEASVDRVNDITETLRELGFRSIPNYRLRDRPVRADIAINVKASNVGIFVNGPLRYTSSQPLRKLGTTLAMQRMVESADWKIMDIPWFEWDAMYDNPDKQTYLEKKMMEAVANKNDDGFF
eukprot:TRINITY_DN29981_c0_g3_i5.p1 TRINITY_DN29981_c0_g3~~TRINITY_DN29981_c0_g3_i5.p1  ORF type:complete len:547 (-),score=52.98 TRINITY_DN29981_c0_g3_i5:626-2245(-)